MPVRSSGCATCRKRRIRCDETRPGCKRCATHGVPCPGYRISQPGGVEFRDVTIFTALKATHQYRQKGYAYEEPPPNKSHSPSTSPSNSSESTPDSETALTLSSRRSSNSQKEFTTNDLTLARTWTDALLPLSLIAGLTRPPQQLQSTSLMSSQIYAVFLDIYLPKDRTFEHNTFFHEMAIRPNHEPALIRSLNALSLAAVSSARHDGPLMQEAIMEYGRALSTLARTVGKKGYTPSDEILAAVTILSLCEFYDGIKQTGGWAKHQRGAQSMILARGGPKGVNTRLSLLLLANSKHSALPRGLLGRQACFVGKKVYRELMFKAPVVDESTYFYDHALRVPELLERRDKLDFGSPLIISDVDQLLEEFAERELALRTWFAGWAPQNQLTGTPIYEKVPIEEFETFASLVKNRLFETAFRFPSYPFGYLTAMYWCTMHCLRSDTLDLYRMRRNLDDAWEPGEEPEMVEADMLQIADNICMCLPYFCEPAASMSGQIGIFLPIGVCGLYYARTQQWKKALWVRDVHENVFVKGMSPPKL